MGVLFLLAAAVQYNDPDAPLWIIVYGIPTLLSFFHSHRRLYAYICLFYGAVVTVGGIGFYLIFVKGEAFLAENGCEAMLGVVEEGREFLGLALVAAWVLILGIYHLYQSSKL